MKWRGDSFLLRIIVLMLLGWFVASLIGCASFTEEYWQEEYTRLQGEGKLEKETGSGMVSVCDLTDCIFVWID